MKTNPKLKPDFSSLRQQPNSIQNLDMSFQKQEIKPTRQLQRKPSNSTLHGQKLKNQNNQIQYSFESPRYMIATPLKFGVVNIGSNSTNAEQVISHFNQDIKTQRKQLAADKSVQKSIRGKRPIQDSADYYKYWKKKANQYQQQNFNLHKVNSSLQQQNQILKHKFQKMQKKIIKIYQAQPCSQSNDKTQNYEKLQNYYKAKIDQMIKKIQQQQLLIQKQTKKIKQLSKYISENYQLKNLLDNMEQKYSQMRSVCSKEDSRAGSIEKMSEKGNKNKKTNDHLTIQYLEDRNSKSNYVISQRKNKGSHYDPSQNRFESIYWQ